MSTTKFAISPEQSASLSSVSNTNRTREQLKKHNHIHTENYCSMIFTREGNYSRDCKVKKIKLRGQEKR